MKQLKLPWFGGILLAGLLTLTVACSDEDGDGNDDLTPDGEASPAATMTQPPANGEANDRDEFVTTVEAQLEQLQTQIDELEKEIDTMSGDQQSDAQARLQDLKDQKSEIESDLDNVDSASDEDYENLKTEIEDRVENQMTEAQELADEIGI